MMFEQSTSACPHGTKVLGEAFREYWKEPPDGRRGQEYKDGAHHPVFLTPPSSVRLLKGSTMPQCAPALILLQPSVHRHPHHLYRIVKLEQSKKGDRGNMRSCSVKHTAKKREQEMPQECYDGGGMRMMMMTMMMMTPYWTFKVAPRLLSLARRTATGLNHRKTRNGSRHDVTTLMLG